MGSIGTLGTPHRFVYAAKSYAIGLSGLVVKFLRPDFTLTSTLPLVEFSQGGFTGLYYVDLITSTTDPEGDWIATVLSPSEGIRDTARVFFSKPIQTIIRESMGEKVVGFIADTAEIEGMVSDPISIIGFVDDASTALGDLDFLDPALGPSFDGGN